MDNQLFSEKTEVEEVVAEYFVKTSQESNDSSLSRPLRKYHIFERIAGMINAQKSSHGLVSAVYRSEDNFFKSRPMPQGSLSEEQLKEIEDFWAPYSFAYKNNPETQRYYSLTSGRFDPSYISFGLNYHCLKKFWDSYKTPSISDKNNYGILFPDVKRPKVIFSRIGGAYYDASGEPTKKEDAARMCVDAVCHDGKFLTLKPARGKWAKGDIFFGKDSTQGKVIERLNDIEFEDIICQVATDNHSTWKHSSCRGIVTARIMTVVFKGKPEITSSYLNMTVRDTKNAASTWGVRISNDGSLDGRAVEIYRGTWHDSFPNGDAFAGKTLYNYEKVKEAVISMAKRITELKAISWDVTLDADGNVVLIDITPGGSPGEYQVYGGHPYGGKEKLKEILEECLIKRFYYERADWEWDYWEFKNTVSICKYAGLEKVVHVPDRLNGKKVTAVREYAFTGKNLKKIIVTDGVKLISPNAFVGCGKDCKIFTPYSQTVYRKIYRMLESLPCGNKVSEFLRDCWMEVNVKRTSNILTFVIKRLSRGK